MPFLPEHSNGLSSLLCLSMAAASEDKDADDGGVADK